jgi:predicted ATPase
MLNAKCLQTVTNHFHVITGGPGSGKTSLVDALAAEDFRHIPEAGRAIIQAQVDIGGTALSWADRESFATLMLGWGCDPTVKPPAPPLPSSSRHP